MLPQIIKRYFPTRYRLFLPALVIAGVLLSFSQVRQILIRDTLTTNHGFSDRFVDMTKFTAHLNLGSVLNGFSPTLSPQTYTKYNNGSSDEVENPV
ncbi:hypothetical protein KP79_PYT17443 [Mizuhopecten yessoensis]|uniref:Uncharacterized protein n=1 Tax=Mizuhopecten yessoensis TaxID=6573 RepID=A0A210QSU4_MIZYE|nr:hypothetical protein KP79_PYT17443 [Mizuhopecten yessoensis]